jgi:predicted transcriptional regulator
MSRLGFSVYSPKGRCTLNSTPEEQTKWIISYLEARFTRLEDRMDSVAEGLDERLNRSEDKLQELLDNQASRIEELNRQVDRLEAKHVKLDSQAGFVRNLLAFVGTAVLSLLGWLASYFLSGPAK